MVPFSIFVFLLIKLLFIVDHQSLHNIINEARFRITFYYYINHMT